LSQQRDRDGKYLHAKPGEQSRLRRDILATIAQLAINLVLHFGCDRDIPHRPWGMPSIIRVHGLEAAFVSERDRYAITEGIQEIVFLVFVLVPNPETLNLLD
jgi:hypothetical protein